MLASSVRVLEDNLKFLNNVRLDFPIALLIPKLIMLNKTYSVHLIWFWTTMVN